eukprot:2220055-Amphidinium_carterae.2
MWMAMIGCCMIYAHQYAGVRQFQNLPSHLCCPGTCTENRSLHIILDPGEDLQLRASPNEYDVLLYM